MPLLDQLNNFAFTHPLPDDWTAWGGFVFVILVITVVVVYDSCSRLFR